MERGRLDVPAGADIGLFLLSDGRRDHRPTLAPVVGVGEVFRLYADTLTAGAKEATTRKCEGIHLRHLERLLGARTPAAHVGTAAIQGYVDRRAKERYNGKPISTQTIRKEVATLRTVWTWAARRGHVTAPAEAVGITFPKGREKVPFRTHDQIAAIVAAAG